MTTNEATAAWLDEHHVKHRWVEQLPIDQIDMARSLQNQARLEALDPDTVDRYTVDYSNGATFPAVVAYKPSARATKFVLIGGNHRITSAQAAGRQTHPAFVIDEIEPELVTFLGYDDNRRHGRPPSRRELVAQAVHLVNQGWTGLDAANALGIAQSEVSNAINVARSSARASTLKVKGYDALPNIARVELGRITLDPAFAAATKVAVVTGMSGGDAAKFAKRIRKAPTETDALKIIDDELEERRAVAQGTVGGKVRKMSDYAKVAMACTSIVDIVPTEYVASLPDNSPEARAKLRERLQETQGKLNQLERALGGRAKR